MAGWRTVLSWALSRKALPLVLPMSHDTMKVIPWDLLSLGCSHAIVKGVVDAIRARHRRFRLAPPLSGDRAYARLMQQQHPLKLPITRDLVVSCLRALPGLSPAQQRDCLATVVATLTDLRPYAPRRARACKSVTSRTTLTPVTGRPIGGLRRSTSCAANATRTARGTTLASGVPWIPAWTSCPS
jgi:hypothetical protein